MRIGFASTWKNAQNVTQSFSSLETMSNNGSTLMIVVSTMIIQQQTNMIDALPILWDNDCSSSVKDQKKFTNVVVKDSSLINSILLTTKGGAGISSVTQLCGTSFVTTMDR